MILYRRLVLIDTLERVANASHSAVLSVVEKSDWGNGEIVVLKQFVRYRLPCMFV